MEIAADGEEGIDHVRVEMAAPPLGEQGDRGRAGQGLLVRPTRGQGVEDVGDGEDPGHQRDRLPRPPLRRAAAVKLFMMRAHDLGGVGEPHRPLDDVEAVPDVLLHLAELLFVEAAGLEQDVVANADLADIVEKRPLDQGLDVAGRQAELFRQADGVEGDPEVVAVGVAVALGDRAGQDRQRFEVGVEQGAREGHQFTGQQQDDRIEQGAGGQDDQDGDEGTAPQIFADPDQNGLCRGEDGLGETDPLPPVGDRQHGEGMHPAADQHVAGCRGGPAPGRGVGPDEIQHRADQGIVALQPLLAVAHPGADEPDIDELAALPPKVDCHPFVEGAAEGGALIALPCLDELHGPPGDRLDIGLHLLDHPRPESPPFDDGYDDRRHQGDQHRHHRQPDCQGAVDEGLQGLGAGSCHWRSPENGADGRRTGLGAPAFTAGWRCPRSCPRDRIAGPIGHPYSE